MSRGWITCWQDLAVGEGGADRRQDLLGEDQGPSCRGQRSAAGTEQERELLFAE